MKVALVIDTLLRFGGATKLLIALKKIFPKATIYTLLYDAKQQHEYEHIISTWNIKTSFLDKWPLKPIVKGHYSILSPIAIEQFTFDEYDIVISISAGAAKGIITSDHTKHISIILTPPRFYWKTDDPDFYIKQFKQQKLLHSILQFTNTYVRIWDYQAAHRADSYITISNYIAQRVQLIYKLQSTVINPPVFFTTMTKTDINVPFKKYLIAHSRLYAYKRIDLAIKAAAKINLPIVIIGEGPEKKYLEKLANKHNVKAIFTGWINEAQAQALVKNAAASIFCGTEDFGLVMAESIILGTPVIAYQKGGACDIIKNNKTGIFFNQQTVDSISQAINKLKSFKFSKQEQEKLKKKLSISNFKEQLYEVINDIMLY